MNNTRINAINVRKEMSQFFVHDFGIKGKEKTVIFKPKKWYDIEVNAEVVCAARFDSKKRIKGWRA